MAMTTLLVLVMAAAAVLWMYAPARPAPVRVRRNPLQEDLLAHYSAVDR
jgi:hypothetical protein